LERAPALKEIAEALKNYESGSMFVGDSIPEEKLFNAITAYAPDLSPADVLLLYDATWLGGARNGMIFTADSIYWRINSWTAPRRYFYSEIEEVTWIRTRLVSSRLITNEKEMVYKWWDFPDFKVKILAGIITRLVKLYRSVQN
jgi:hypothetical protein